MSNFEARPRDIRRKFVDRAACLLIASSGLLLLLCFPVVLFVLLSEVLPLFQGADVGPATARTLSVPGTPLLLSVDEYREIALVVTPDGGRFVSLQDGSTVLDAPALDPSPATITSASWEKRSLFLGLSDGRILSADVTFETSYRDGRRTIKPRVEAQPPPAAESGGRPVRLVAQGFGEQGRVTAAVFGSRDLTIAGSRRKRSLSGEGKPISTIRRVDFPIDSEITAAAMDDRAEDLFLGTASGLLVRIDLRDPANPQAAPPIRVVEKEGAAVTALGFLVGGRTLIVGDGSGGVSSWQTLTSPSNERRTVKLRTFEGHGAAVVSLCSSSGDRTFLSLDAKGGLSLRHGTTGETPIMLKTWATAMTLTPRGDGIVAAETGGLLVCRDLREPHSGITFASLFLPTLYEGSAEPELVWQPVSGRDDFEPKYSLTPLIFGTLKGTFYALLVSVPLALLSALYVSQFMQPSLKAVVKPVIAMIAMVPTVVIGAIALVWLAPALEKVVPDFLLLAGVNGSLILASLAVWRRLPARTRGRFRPGTEALLLIPIVIVATWLTLRLGGFFEESLLGGDYRKWLSRNLGLAFDQRNSIVVGIAMGFAVVPYIFMIAEDALSSVPPHLVAGSLALGATRWQTAMKIVLPTASPGLLSAVMTGFGRAAGETMIVVMVSGGAAIMSGSPFIGFRALTATFVHEVPCSPEGGTHFRLMFLAALILFLMTFVANTAAEVIRLRLRKKYQSL